MFASTADDSSFASWPVVVEKSCVDFGSLIIYSSNIDGWILCSLRQWLKEYGLTLKWNELNESSNLSQQYLLKRFDR